MLSCDLAEKSHEKDIFKEDNTSNISAKKHRLSFLCLTEFTYVNYTYMM